MVLAVITLAEAAIYLADRGYLAGSRADRQHPPTLRTLQMWCKSGKLQATKAGRDWLVTTEALDALMASGSEAKAKRARWHRIKRKGAAG